MDENIYGLMAEFDNGHELVHAAESARKAGYRAMDAYTPYPIEELDAALGIPHTRIALITLVAGLSGAAGGFGMQVFGASMHYPFIVGGKPPLSWPAFIPITFECGILAASICTVLGLLFINGFPAPYHPVFNVPAFEKASRDGYFLCLESTDPQFNVVSTRKFLETLKPKAVHEVTK